MNSSKNTFANFSALCLLLFIALSLSLSKSGFRADIDCWREWSLYIHKFGLGRVFESGSNYMPLYYYILWIYVKIQGSEQEIISNIHFLKLFTLFIHVVSGIFVFNFLTKKQNSLNSITKSFFYILNIGSVYNTLVWGQVDDILMNLAFFSVLAAYYNNILTSLILFLLAVNFKLQAIIFLPIIFLLAIPYLYQNFSLKNIAKWAITLIAIQSLILFPFFKAGTLTLFIDVITGSVGKYPFVSMNAYNLWNLLIPGELTTVHDSITFAGLTYKRWGFIFFFTLSFITFLPILKTLYATLILKKEVKISLEKTLLISALIGILFFYVNTQMHERYVQPAIAFLLLWSFLKENYIITNLVSVAYVLNMEGVLKHFDFQNYQTLIFNKSFISILFLTSLIYLYYQLFKNEIKSE